jgi:hypothetical protein
MLVRAKDAVSGTASQSHRGGVLLNADRRGLSEATTRALLVLLGDEGIGHDPTADLVDRAHIVADLLKHDRYHVECHRLNRR